MKKISIQILFLITIVSTISIAQVAGDFRTAGTRLKTGSLWSAVANWQTYSGSAWTSSTTLPTSTSNVSIVAGDTLSLDVSSTVNSLTILSGARLNPNSITLGGNITVNGALAISGTSFTILGNLTVSGSNASVNFSNTSSKLNFTGTNQTLTVGNGATFQQVGTSAAAPWNPAGSLTGTYTLVVNNSPVNTTIVYKTQGNYTLPSLPNNQAYGNLTFTSASNSTATVTLANDINIAGNLGFATTSPSAMSWNMASFKIISAGGSLKDTATTALHAFTGTGPDLFKGFSSYSFVPKSGACTVTYSGANQNVLGGAYQNLTIAGSGNMPLTATATVSGTLTLTSGNLDNSKYQITVTGSTVTTGGTISKPPLTTGVEGLNNSIPNTYELSQNYPNPFNPTTEINFAIPKSSFVTLKVYDMLGKEVSELVNDFKNAGNYKVNFDASRLSSGVYFYKLQSASFTQTKKILLMK